MSRFAFTRLRVLYTLAITVLAMVAVSLAYVLYLLLYPLDIVELKGFTTATSVAQNDRLAYTLSFEKKLNYKPELRYYITSPEAASVEIVVDAINRPIGTQKREVSISIPASVEPGCGKRLVADVSYHIILNTERPYHWEASNTFCVTEGGP